MTETFSAEIDLSFTDLESRLVRIIAKLTRMAMKFDGVSESSSEYNSSVDYEHEHRPPRRTEHEHDEEPEQNHAPKFPADVA